MCLLVSMNTYNYFYMNNMSRKKFQCVIFSYKCTHMLFHFSSYKSHKKSILTFLAKRKRGYRTCLSILKEYKEASSLNTAVKTFISLIRGRFIELAPSRFTEQTQSSDSRNYTPLVLPLFCKSFLKSQSLI